MGLEDFEKELAAAKSQEPSRKRHRSRSREDRHSHRQDKHRHRHHHRSSSHHRSRHDQHESSSSSRHEHKRRDRRHEPERKRSHSPRRSQSPVRSNHHDDDDDDDDDDDNDDALDPDEWVEKEAPAAPSIGVPVPAAPPQRDSWMEAPSSLNIDYVQTSRHRKSPPSQFVSAKEQPDSKIHKHDTDLLLKDLQEQEDDGDATGEPEAQGSSLDKSSQPEHKVTYTFGDSGSQWRMTKLRGVYRKAEECAQPLDHIALETYGDLETFDDAREEERELDRRSMYGNSYAGLEKPSGELYNERLREIAQRQKSTPIATPAHGQNHASIDQTELPAIGQVMQEAPAPTRTVPLDQSALNKLKAQILKARLRKASNLAQLEAEYDAASTAAAANPVQSNVIVLDPVQNRMLAGGRQSEVTNVENRRGRERGHVVENEDMSVDDMVRQEKRTRGQFGGQGRAFAESIAKDGKFDDNLDYMDENAAKLAKTVTKSNLNLRNTAVGDLQKMQKILDSCPLCHHEDTNTPPAAPVVSLATRVYMTLTTEPEVALGGAVIVPIQHHLNLLECDDDEWDEIRNFMKSLTRMYHQRDKAVIFYENAAHMHSRKGHAALFAVPLPFHLADNAPAYFREAVLGADEEWSQHQKVIDTLAKSQQSGFGKQAFRKSLVKEMPYFHVWFTMDGGLGHVIEDERRWPKGDLFAREIIGGMLAKGPEVVKKQGRWTRQDSRVDGFRKRWNPFDWTRVLYDAQ